MYKFNQKNAGLLVLYVFLCIQLGMAQQTIYIDPTNTNDSSQDGSIDHPYDSWKDFSFKSGGIYLQKRGTIASCTAIDITANDVTLGAYGAGAKPKISFNLKSGEHAIRAYSKKNLVFENLEIFPVASGVSCIYFNAYCTNNLVDSCILHGATWGIRITSGNNSGHIIQNTEIYDNGDDGIFVQDATDIEIAGCYIHHVNTDWQPPETSQSEASGDCVQLERTDDWYVHHNVMDRSDSGNKFCFISNWEEVEGCVLEHNVFIGPKKTNEGGACVYFGGGDGLIIRYNTFRDTDISGIYSHATNMSIYGNIFDNMSGGVWASSTCELYNNVFHNVGTAAQATTMIIKNNIFDAAKIRVSRPESSHNHFTSGSTGDHVTTGDPMFVDPDNGDFHLQSGSPCIDAGIDVGITLDKDGNSIPHNGIPDIGAFEFESTSAVDLSADNLPDQFVLAQNYPNPFNSSTTIEFTVPGAEPTKLCIYNMLGQEIVTLADKVLQSGLNSVSWDGRDKNGIPVESGVYLYKLNSADFCLSKKMLLIK